MEEYLGVGKTNSEAQLQWFQCPEGLAPVGISASSNCLGLNSVQVGGLLCNGVASDR